MGLFDPTSLKFNVSSISSMRSELRKKATELSTLSTDLLAEIEALRETWKTPAGEVFFEKFDTGWSEEVKKYITIIDAVDELLSVAESNYAEVEEETKKISF